MHPILRLQRMALAWFAAALAVLAAGCGSMTPASGGAQRLYVLYCGEAQIPDVSAWSPGFQKAEYAAAFGSEPAKYGFVPATYDRLRSSRVIQLEGDFDVFDDGSVRILSTPGHTPGHQSLLVRLPQIGAVVLSGDAAHFEENFAKRRVPGFNFDKEQSLQSMDKLDRVVKAERAQLWINHDAAQNATLLHSPKFYQ